MRKYWFGGLLLAVLAAVMLLPAGRDQNKDTSPPAPAPLTVKQEIHDKHKILQADLAHTDRLCRMQCATDLNRAAAEINKAETKNAQLVGKQLDQLRKKNVHMLYTAWLDPNQPAESGKLTEELRKLVAPAMDKAKESLKRNKPYESESIRHQGESYFVSAVPSGKPGSGIVSVVHQRILADVEQKQKQNLRLVPYPKEGKYKVESVKSGTNGDVTVKNGEDNQGTSHYHVNEVVVRFRELPTQEMLKQMEQETGSGPVRKLGYTYVFRSDKMDAQELMDYFARWNPVYVEPHYLYLTNDQTAQPATDNSSAGAIVPNDLLYSKYQWNLPIIETEKGWSYSRGKDDVIIAVIDTGVDLNHPDLKGKLLDGRNIIDENAAPQDDVGHGTHVAGIISAVVNNGEGVAGMTWHNKILPVKALDSSGSGSTYSVAQAIIWATDHGAKVINLSLGNYADAQFLHDAVRYAYDRDVVLVAASGNDNTSQPGYPAAYPEVFAVAATDSGQKRASFSNYGDYIDAAAPGVNIASTYLNGQYAALSGTSMASPHVAALAGLIRSINPDLSNEQVMDIMRRSARDLGAKGKDAEFGYGQIDVKQALEWASPQTQTTTLNGWTEQLRRRINAIIERYSK
jgi:type VII secretion-associated serine protease mycosin